MPHIVLEYSVNLEEKLDISALLGVVHHAALETGMFPIGELRTRGAAREHYVIADGDPSNAFVHALLRIGHGRDLDTKRRAAAQVFDALCGYLEPTFQSIPLGISLEVEEINPDLSLKQNNLHAIVKSRQAAQK